MGAWAAPPFWQPWGAAVPGAPGQSVRLPPRPSLGLCDLPLLFLCPKRGLEAGADHGLCGVRLCHGEEQGCPEVMSLSRTFLLGSVWLI